MFKHLPKLNKQLADINIKIEKKKTGNILVAGTFNTDTGAGVSFGIEDKNIFGSGNGISSNFLINSEDLKFDVNFTQYPILNQNLTNTYTILIKIMIIQIRLVIKLQERYWLFY